MILPLELQASANQHRSGDEIYIPFWIVLESLDATPPEPFIKCTILRIGNIVMTGPSGSIEYTACDIELGKAGLIAPNIPIEYLIKPEHLEYWATEIAEWFRKYPYSRTT